MRNVQEKYVPKKKKRNKELCNEWKINLQQKNKTILSKKMYSASPTNWNISPSTLCCLPASSWAWWQQCVPPQHHPTTFRATIPTFFRRRIWLIGLILPPVCSWSAPVCKTGGATSLGVIINCLSNIISCLTTRLYLNTQPKKAWPPSCFGLSNKKIKQNIDDYTMFLVTLRNLEQNSIS